ncbi:unnamed protein product [Urochloa humidicola]
MASPAAPIADRCAPQPLPTFTDELLEEIFLRLPTPADLARACTACASFRRIIIDRSFLRRFRAIHPPPLLGFAAGNSFSPAQPPYPSAPLARALAAAADFSYSFVPTSGWLEPWHTADVRQGRVLLECSPTVSSDDSIFLRQVELVVCDPLYRRYVMLPQIPDELTAEQEPLIDVGQFLAPTSEEEEETSFRVICTARNQTKLFVFVFSSITRQWHIAASQSWSSLGTAPPSMEYGFLSFDCAESCFYFTFPWSDKLLVLDALRMEFSIVNDVPSGYCIRGRGHGQPRVVMGAKGIPLVVFLSDSFEDGSSELLCVTELNGSKPSDQWLSNVIPLPIQYKHYTLGAAEGFVILRGWAKDQHSVHYVEGYPEVEYFSLDIRTSELKKICGMKHNLWVARVYFGFPPSLSKPCI